jgi:hypothetical protein
VPSHASSLRRCRLVIILGRRLSALWPGAGLLRHAEPRGRDHGAHGVRGHHLVDAAGQRAVQAERSGMKRAYYALGEISATQGATLYVEYVNTHPETARTPVEQPLILALKAAYPCAG